MTQQKDYVVRDGVLRSKERRCHFCQSMGIEDGHVDIGGLALCVDCYQKRTARTSLPCEVCGTQVPITPNPLTISQICSECDGKADLSAAWKGSSYAKGNKPCDKCGAVDKWRHPTCYGEVVCLDCAAQGKGGVIQCYPGDRGYPICDFSVRKENREAVVLPKVDGDRSCVVCSCSLSDEARVAEITGINATICQECEGPRWWKMREGSIS